MNEKKKWNLLATAEEVKNDEKARAIADALRLFLPTAKLLCLRGYDTPEKARAFLEKSTELLRDPFLMKDMRLAAERILRAVENGEKIVVYGDYDVDGVTSVSSLVLYLRSMGADVEYYIPCRLGEGYGMSEKSVSKIAEGGCQLMITVDTGVTANQETECAKKLGMDIVITDHHECPEVLPKAYAVVNPRRRDCPYPFKELAGVGVVFKLLCAMEILRFSEDSVVNAVSRVCQTYGDLVAIGTIADVMPITDENRLIVTYGLRLIENSDRPGVMELLAASTSDARQTRKRITSSFVGFTLAPRINAAGRIRDAAIAVQLFLANTREEAAPIAKLLCDINKERQNQENEIVSSIRNKYGDSPYLKNDRVIVLSDEYWHHGIIGIVASRITERYGRPSVMISFEKSGGNPDIAQTAALSDEDMGKGSCRGVAGIHLVDAMAACSDLLEKFGGHELAAGLTIKRKNLDAFRQRINAYAKENMEEALAPTLTADCELTLQDISIKQATELYKLEPFGVANAMPVFLLQNVQLRELNPVGGGKHLRLSVGTRHHSVTAMCFRTTVSDLNIFPGDFVDVMFNLDVNEFQNNQTVQLIVKDIRLTEDIVAEEDGEDALYRRITAWLEGKGPAPSMPDGVLPTRDDLAYVYKLLRSELRVRREVYSLRALRHYIASTGKEIGSVKLRFIIDVFREMGLLSVDVSEDEMIIYQFGYLNVAGKVNLENSRILQKLAELSAS